MYPRKRTNTHKMEGALKRPYVHSYNFLKTGMVRGIFRNGDDSSNRGAKVRFLGYYKCQNYFVIFRGIKS